MFRIKICGVTRPADARAIVAAGADAIGLNFYPKSPRCATHEAAHAIVAALPREMLKVGVFVNAPPAEICERAAEFSLDAIQLHGDEPPALIAELAPLKVIRAWRSKADSWKELTSYLDECRRLDALPHALIVDAHQPGAYGGTGATVDWQELAAERERLAGIPLILAGGLKPANVAEAIRIVAPHGVDTASGVESSPGVKNPQLVREFIENARGAFH